MIHDLKTHPKFFVRIFEGIKKFEVRKNDRDFQIGDILFLREWCPDKKEYTTREMRKQVGYVLNGGQFGIEDGYCVMSLIDL